MEAGARACTRFSQDSMDGTLFAQNAMALTLGRLAKGEICKPCCRCGVREEETAR